MDAGTACRRPRRAVFDRFILRRTTLVRRHLRLVHLAASRCLAVGSVQGTVDVNTLCEGASEL